jgi:cytochrome c oxidase subunit III
MATETHAAAVEGHEAHGAVPYLHHHFDDLTQQRETTSLAMWAFLATEAMMFGGLFLAYSVYRYLYPFAYAEGSHHLNTALGTVNTFILLTSSLFMAMAVHAAALRNRRQLILYLVITWIFAAGFLVVKGFEWTADYQEGIMPAVHWTYYDQPEHAAVVQKLAQEHVLPNHVMMFFVMYFCMVGLHGIHVVIGMIIIGTLIVLSAKGRFTEGNDQPVEISGLYWHFVDIVWVFLYPLFYLIVIGRQ